MTATVPAEPRTFKIIQRRRYVLVAEASWWVADERRVEGDFTARWFFDKAEQRWYMAESWQRPNKRYPIPNDKANDIAGIILRSHLVRA